MELFELQTTVETRWKPVNNSIIWDLKMNVNCTLLNPECIWPAVCKTPAWDHCLIGIICEFCSLIKFQCWHVCSSTDQKSRGGRTPVFDDCFPKGGDPNIPLKSSSVRFVGSISNQRHNEKGEKKGLKTKFKN